MIEVLEVTLDITLGLVFLDKHKLVEFWSWTPPRRALQTGERRPLAPPECLPEYAPVQTGFFDCRPTKYTRTLNMQGHKDYI